MMIFSENADSKNINYKYKVSQILLYFMALTTFFPPIRAVSFFNSLWFLLLVLWFLFSVAGTPRFFLKVTFFRFMVYFFFFYTITIPIIFGNLMISNRFIEFSQLFVFYFAFQISLRKNDLKSCWNLIGWLSPFVVMTCFITIKENMSNPIISRLAKKGSESGIEQMAQGIGGYEFIYFIVMLIPPLTFYLFANKNEIVRIPLIIKIILYSIFTLLTITIIVSNFATALLLVTVSILTAVFMSRLKANVAFILLLFVLLAIPLLLQLLILFLDFYINFFSDTLNADRIYELKLLITGGGEGDSIGSRFSTFLLSIIAFIENPIFGIITDDLGAGMTDGYLSSFGQHSQILDTFALYGLFIGTLQLYIFSQPFFKFISSSKGMLLFLSILVYFNFILISSINNITPSIGFAALYIFPVFYHWYLNKISRQGVRE